jgi:hypothetical protein
MKRTALIVLSLVVAMLSFSNVRVSADPVGVPLEVGYVDPSDDQDGPGRGPVLVPEVSIEGYTLLFGTNCDGSILRLLDEDGYAVYSTVIPTGTTTLPLPISLSGEYEIQIIQGQWCFYGWIEL